MFPALQDQTLKSCSHEKQTFIFSTFVLHKLVRVQTLKWLTMNNITCTACHHTNSLSKVVMQTVT
jgi:hypothetical protein